MDFGHCCLYRSHGSVCLEPIRKPGQGGGEKEDEMKRIHDLPVWDRPREKLREKGAHSLSDLELLAILIGSGTRGHDVLAMAARLMQVLDGALEITDKACENK